MQQRGINAGMDVESEGQITPPQSRGRNNSKLKVLVRSHAMREEASPPREPTPTALNSPCIKLTPSSDSQPSSPNRHVLVLSPSVSRGTSPSHNSPTLSPTSTLVPSPTRYSPQIHPPDNQSEFTDLESSSPKVNKLNRQNLERFNCRNVQKSTETIVEETSHSRKAKCECTSHSCYYCLRNQERNYNNNLSSNNNNNNLNSSNTLTVSRASMRGKLRHQSSSQGSFEGSSSNSPCLSRDNSSEQYTDTTGVDLEMFIPETLNRNAKDRALMLRIEEELVQLAKDKAKTHFKFPPMSSYQRMLVHRCAAYFGMDHNIESSGKCVVVNKTKNTRIPDVEFRHHVKEDFVFSDPEPRRSILKRDSNSIEDYNFKSPDRQCSLENRRSKSFEEREEEYEKARRRIFNREMHICRTEESMRWADLPWSSTESENLTQYRLHTSEGHPNGRVMGKLLKVQSEDVGEETSRPCVAKSYSFGGYGGVLTRGDSIMSSHSAGPRLFTKQGLTLDSTASSVSWRLSPSSSGYKTQSQRSESVTPSPTSTPYLSGDSARQDSTNSTATNASDIHQDESEEPQVMWAVTNINNVPKGSIIINPQTGQPVMNQDGSVYHHDPENPIPELQQTNPVSSKPPPSPVKSPVKTLRERPPSPKKRSAKTSPVKKTNSSTSPSLPFTPPPPPPRSYSFPPSNDGVPPAQTQQSHQQQFSIYAPSYTPESGVPMYHHQPPCIVFAPYNTHIPVGYDGRVETQMPEIPNYYNMPDTVPNAAPTQPLTYQTVPTQVWNQPMAAAYYQNSQPANATPRYAVPMPQQGAYLTSYPTNYLPPQNVPPSPQNPDMLSMYQQPPSVPVMYPNAPPPTQTNPVMFPNTNIVFTQQNPPQYPTNPVYPPQNISYPVNTPTPNSCTSSMSNTPYHGQVYDPNLGQVVHNISQMTISAQKLQDGRIATPKGKANNSKGICSSQSSTEANSPAMTVVAGYCHTNQGIFRQTPDTPPASNTPSGFVGNFVSPMFFRQMNNVRASPPVTSRGSRSPTPANESHIDRQRYSLPPLVYQGMPYSIQSDTRIVPGRGQPAAYRQTPVRQQSVNQASENKNFKNRRSRGNKTTSLPPNGKQHQHN